MEWKVYFEDNPGCHRPHRGRPGQEVSCGAHSVWGGQHFIIPAIYLCGKGLVVDICRRVEREAIEAHYQKLAAYEGMDIDECPPEVVELAEAEDPFGSFDYLPSAAINGKTVEYSRGAGEYYNPLRSEEEIVCSGEQAARDIVKHYGLDPEQGWDLRQWSFPWATKQAGPHHQPDTDPHPAGTACRSGAVHGSAREDRGVCPPRHRCALRADGQRPETGPAAGE